MLECLRSRKYLLIFTIILLFVSLSIIYLICHNICSNDKSLSVVHNYLESLSSLNYCNLKNLFTERLKTSMIIRIENMIKNNIITPQSNSSNILDIALEDHTIGFHVYVKNRKFHIEKYKKISGDIIYVVKIVSNSNICLVIILNNDSRKWLVDDIKVARIKDIDLVIQSYFKEQ